MGRNLLRIAGTVIVGMGLALLVNDMRSSGGPGYLWLIVGGIGALLWHYGSRRPAGDGPGA